MASVFSLEQNLALHAVAVNTKKKPGDYQVRLAKWAGRIRYSAAKPEKATIFGDMAFKRGPVAQPGCSGILFGF